MVPYVGDVVPYIPFVPHGPSPFRNHMDGTVLWTSGSMEVAMMMMMMMGRSMWFPEKY